MRIYRLIFAILGIITCFSIALQVTPATVINQGASPLPVVDINVPAETPVRIVNFRFDRSPAGMRAFHYDIQNVSGQGLVAVEVRWQTYYGDKPGASITNRDDRWLTGLLASNDSARFQVSNISGPGGQPLTRLAPTVTYAEFEDGSRLGADAARVGQQVTAARKTTVATYARLLETFNGGGSQALVQALKQQNATPGLDPATQASTAHLLGLLADQGVDAVVLELQRVSAMSLPEARP
jgi:hypothetical protein